MGDLPVASEAWMFGAVAVTYLVFLLLTRRRLVGLLDPLNINAGYFACAYAFVGWAIWWGSPLGWHLSILLVTYLVALLVCLEPREAFSGPEFGRKREAFRNSRAAQGFVIAAAVLVLANDLINIGLSGYNVGVDSGQGRWQISSHSHLLFYIGISLARIMFLATYVFRGTLAGRLAGLAFILVPVFGFLSGSKTQMLIFFFELAWIGYMARIDGEPRRQGSTLRFALIGAIVLPLSWMLVLISLAHNPQGLDPTTIFVTRLFGTFAQLILTTLARLPVEHLHVNFLQLYFISFLKMIGANTLPFNGAGDYVVRTLFGDNPQRMFPNDNLALEAMMSFGYPAAIFVVAAIGAGTAGFINFLFKRRYDGVIYFLYFGYLLTGPFDTMLGGAANFTRWYALLLPYGFWSIARALGRWASTVPRTGGIGSFSTRGEPAAGSSLQRG